MVSHDYLAETSPPASTPFTSETAAPEREIGPAFVQACQETTSENDARLRHAIVGLVERLKRDGLPPERVVIALKAAIAEDKGARAVLSLLGEMDDGRDRNCRIRNATYARAFNWCLDAYYGAP